MVTAGVLEQTKLYMSLELEPNISNVDFQTSQSLSYNFISSSYIVYL